MKLPLLQGRSLAMAAVIVPLAGLLGYTALRSGPLAPVAVTATEVKALALRPALFGIGTVEARYTYKIGPTFAGRLKRLEVQVGDTVKAGQWLGEMDPVDLDSRIGAQTAAVKRAEAAIREATARQNYAAAQAQRYEQLFTARSTSEETLITKRQESAIAEAALAAAQEEVSRVRSERDALRAQRGNLRLLAPANGIVTLRDADPGSTVVAGQTVVELIDPSSIWINARFDQISAAGLAGQLPARIQLRSRSGTALPARVLRLEPKADAVTEELLVKLVFEQLPSPLPPMGELAEVTVDLPPLAAAPVIPNAAIQRQGNQTGVWKIVAGAPKFAPLQLGRSDLDGQVQVLQGLQAGERIVVHSEKALAANKRLQIVERIPGVVQ